MDENKLKIVTHNAGFHIDDIFAVATLSLALELEDKEFTITRSRDQDIIQSADYVLDVGGIYDEDLNRFDHHQEGGAGKRENGVPYASFGLVWKKFGPVLCGDLGIAERLDRSIAQPIDANDNGVQFIESIIPGLMPLDVGYIRYLFYPTWKEDMTKTDDIFLELVKYAKVLLRRIIKVNQDDLEAEKLVMDDFKATEDKRLIILSNSRYPWEEVYSKLEEPLYVVYKNINNDTWSIKGVRNDLNNYKTRKKLPESWAGKTGEELEKITGVEGAVFCHNARFMAVAKTKEAILHMAEIALKD